MNKEKNEKKISFGVGKQTEGTEKWKYRFKKYLEDRG